jgi:hypothetical protein
MSFVLFCGARSGFGAWGRSFVIARQRINLSLFVALSFRPCDSRFGVVVVQNGEETLFKVKKTTKMSKVFDAYASRKGVDTKSLRFMFDGTRLNADETPEEVRGCSLWNWLCTFVASELMAFAACVQTGLEDQDTIDVMVQQVGGSW